MRYLFIFLFLFSQAIFAESSSGSGENITDKALEYTNKALNVVGDSVKAVNTELNSTRTSREKSKYFAIGSYSAADLIIPGKWGVTAGKVLNADKTYELEYLRGSLSIPFFIDNLGGMTEQRLSFIARSYFGYNSFNVGYGITYNDFSIKYGSDLLNRISGSYPSSVESLSIKTLGVNFSIGNRWQISDNIIFGLDWFSWSQPITEIERKNDFTKYATNQNDKDESEKAARSISYLPRFAVLKLQLGISF